MNGVSRAAEFAARLEQFGHRSGLFAAETGVVLFLSQKRHETKRNRTQLTSSVEYVLDRIDHLLRVGLAGHFIFAKKGTIRTMTTSRPSDLFSVKIPKKPNPHRISTPRSRRKFKIPLYVIGSMKFNDVGIQSLRRG